MERRWVRVCAAAEAPAVGQVAEGDAEGVMVCLANADGKVTAMDNLCPHRQGPLGQGWLEGTAVVCPWHSWAFDLGTGRCEYPGGQGVTVFPVEVRDEGVFVQVPGPAR